MITPTIGRVVWYFSPALVKAHQVGEGANVQPLKADVAYVHSERLINIGYLDSEGRAHNATAVPLLQDDDAPVDTGFCVWMPYQKGQAAKTEAAEAAAMPKVNGGATSIPTGETLWQTGENKFVTEQYARENGITIPPGAATIQVPRTGDSLREFEKDTAGIVEGASQETFGDSQSMRDNPAGMSDAELDRATDPAADGKAAG